jgi:hypothetical protein
MAAPKPVQLNEAALKALKREAQRDLQNSLGERYLLKRRPNARPDAANEFERQLLAAADVLGAIDAVKFEQSPQLIEFSEEALAWLRKACEENQASLAYLDEGNEAGYSYNAKEAYLVHVLGLVVAAQDGGDS